MALMLGVSKRTVENRMAEFELTNRSRYSNIDDVMLDAHVERIIAILARSGTWLCNIYCHSYVIVPWAQSRETFVGSKIYNCTGARHSYKYECTFLLNYAVILLGLKTIEGELLAQGICVQRHRFRSSVKRVDPVGRRLRAFANIRRRVYNVHSPLALWHLDGNHKLIRYAFETQLLKSTRAVFGNELHCWRSK